MPPALPPAPAHGAACLPCVHVDDHSAELRDAEGFVGDHANKAAFTEILRQWRRRIRDAGDDPFGEQSTDEIGRQWLEEALIRGPADAAGLVLTAIEDFAQQLVLVCRRLLALEPWRSVERIAVGGGFRGNRIGELAIGRAGVLLKAEGHAVEVWPIRHDPEEAGMIGALHLLPPGALGDTGFLAADIGGTNIRVGLLVPEDGDARVLCTSLWRHADDRPDRDGAVRRLAEMLGEMIDAAEKRGKALAPFVGIGCPGVVCEDGRILRGGQNLPGNWEDPDFNLPQALAAQLPEIGGQRPVVVLHNDAVLQGLSELPRMRDVRHWGILTIGTGLGNAVFSNRDG